MKNRFLFAPVAVALCGALCMAADQQFTLSGDNTKLTFIGTKPDGKHAGGFTKLSGTATIRDANPDSLKIEATIETASLYSDDPKLTAHLKSPDFFSVKDNPKATFQSTKVEKTKNGYTIHGELTLLGKTKAVALPALVTPAANSLTLSSTFTINRTDWGMTYGAGKIHDKVTLTLTITAKK